MHILLLGLQIAGLAIGVLLLLLLLVLLLVLFAPVRYRAEVEKEKEIEGHARISWLFPLAVCRMAYTGGQGSIQVRILGIPLRKRRKKKSSSGRRRDRHEKKGEPLTAAELGQDRRRADEEKTGNLQEEIDPLEPGTDEGNEGGGREFSGEKPCKGQSKDPGYKDEEAFFTKERSEEGKHGSIRMGILRRLIHGIRKVWDCIRKTVYAVKQGCNSLYNKITDFCKLLGQIHGKGILLRAFFQEEGNRRGFRRMFLALRGIVKHIRPQKLEGWLHFGLQDPADTGIVLGYASIFYGWSGGGVEFLPDFEHEVLKGTFRVKGRVRVFTLIRICITLWLDDDFQWLRKSAYRLKEEL